MANRFCRLIGLFILVTIYTGCATVPFDQPKPYSKTLSDTTDTRLGKEIATWVAEHDGQSGVYPLSEGMDALGVRLRLAEVAEKSIDLQYFLMKQDTAGLVIMNALLKAADRGVRVRFLLDDIFTTAQDQALLLINQHPNIEVRLFNPISRRGFATLNLVGDFRQANRRMHNKSFTADNQVSVVGGRNIADEYFDLKTGSEFVDFDVLVLGPIVNDISESFDEYWNHSRAVAIDRIAANKADEDLETVRAEIEEEFNGLYDTIYGRALESQLLQDLIADRRRLFPAEMRVLSDSPDKLINEISEEHMRLATNLRQVLLSAEKEVIFISPYYVPGEGGVELVRNLVDKGIRVVILTNSLASNNHVPVHGGYARYRKKVIKAGAELHEARVNSARERRGSNEGPDTLTLHTKAFLIDRRYLFVGSLNLDPRSIEINAEMGLLIDSEELIAYVVPNPEERLEKTAYRVLVNEDGELEWHGRIQGEEVVETKEPDTSAWLRFKAWILRIAPESQL
ncbi:MAG: phospholipase D family protein [Gammaproteobacteria bacterium]|nr:phospholipase D family protein [Gammaproteobacteria bacterium]NNJ97774.1 phospholipase D family protein [Gammaproteobacteria bacterium]